MSKRESGCGSPVPPGYKPLPKAAKVNNTHTVPYNVNVSNTTNTNTNVGVTFSPKSCRDCSCVDNQQAVPSVDPSDNDKRITRKRNKPDMFDPSPPSTHKRPDPSPPSTHKRPRGRPPGSSRKQSLSSLLAQGNQEIGKETGSEDNNLSELLQFGKHVVQVNTSPVILQSKQHSQSTKREVDDQPSTTCAHETTNRVTTSQVGSYTVSQSLAPILQAIINKHGDVVKDCPLKSGYMRTSLVEGICKVVQELQKMELTQLDSSHLNAYYSAVKDAKLMKLDVKWLQERLDEIRQVVQSNVEAKKLTDIKTKRVERSEVMKKELQKLKSEIEAKECQLAVETLEIEKLNSTIRGMTSQSHRLQGKSLLDGLL